MKKNTWVIPALITVIVVAFVAAVFLVPVVGAPIKSVTSTLKTESLFSTRLFINLNMGRSPMSILLLGVWQSLLPIAPPTGIVLAAADMFGVAGGLLLAWSGLFLGSLLSYGLMRGLLGGLIDRLRERVTKKPLPEPTNVSRLVMLGVRLIPFIPQGYVSYALGATRVRFLDVVWTSAVSAAVTVLVIFLGLPAFTWGMAALGAAVLVFVTWQNRERLPKRELTREHKKKLAIGGAVVALLVALYFLVPGLKEWVTEAVRVISGNPAGVAEYIRGFGIWGPLVSATLMVLQSVAAPLPAFVITFANGMIWGWIAGAALSWSSAMAGAALCFWIARIFGRPVVEKFVGGSSALEVSDMFFKKYGDRTVVVARLLPFVSFDLISYGAGLTEMGFWRFFIATGIGQLPATLVYSYLASVGGAATSIKVLLYVFIGTAVLMIIGMSFRPYFMKKLREDTASEKGEELRF